MKINIRPKLAVMALSLSNTISSASTVFRGPFPEGVPGSGYGCSNPCNTGDVNYVIEANIETFEIPGTKQSDLFRGEQDVKMYTRTWQGNPDFSSPFCLNMSGIDGPLGPCIRVNPGQTMNVKIVNNMDNGMELFRQHRAELAEYWQMAQDPANNLDNITYFGRAPDSPGDMIVVNEQDLPGWDEAFDDVNLHIHGMQVVPHLFYPLGTGNASAEWITIQPASENPDQKCFCYVFDVPTDHPQGTYFYHVHRHGSTAMQAWAGMVGYLLVGDKNSDGAPEKELTDQGITREEPLALWEWAVDTTNKVMGANDTYMEGQFLGDMDKVFVTNNAYQPVFDMCVDETVHFRLLCAQATTGSALYIVDEKNEEVTFWVFGADGISYDRAYEKRALLIGPGQREAVLLQFSKPGTYRIMQLVINDFQDQGETAGDDIEPAATIVVHIAGEGGCSSVPIDPIKLSSLRFTPGRKNEVSISDIDHQISVNFEVQSQLDKAPVPQFVIDGHSFDYRHITHNVSANSAQQWTLTSNMNYFHPFHIHINPFQVEDVTSGYIPGVLPTGMTLEDALISTVMEPLHQYRDTVMIPPFGLVSIYQKFGAGTSWSGKTVYHCHFMDHEDQGMIAAMMVFNPQEEHAEDNSGRQRRMLRG